MNALESLGFASLFDDVLEPADEGIKESFANIKNTVKEWFTKLIQKIKDFFAIHITKLKFMFTNKKFEEKLKLYSKNNEVMVRIGYDKFNAFYHNMVFKTYNEIMTDGQSSANSIIQILEKYVETYSSPDCYYYDDISEGPSRSAAIGVPDKLDVKIKELVEELSKGPKATIGVLYKPEDTTASKESVAKIISGVNKITESIYTASKNLILVRDRLLKAVDKANSNLSKVEVNPHDHKASLAYGCMQNEMTNITKMVNFELISVGKYLSIGYRVYVNYIARLNEIILWKYKNPVINNEPIINN